jgi:hypothetical protein
LSKYIQTRKYFLLAIILICQTGLFLVLKLYFFEAFTKEVFYKPTDNGTTTNNTANATNSTLLL